MTTAPSLPNLRETIVHDSALRDTFRSDVLEGLARPRKSIEPKHLYDDRGSEIFERICEVPEYYPTRTETRIFERRIGEIAGAIGAGATLIEPGAGSGEKAERLLGAMEDPRAFVPMEISGAALADAAERVAERYPEIDVLPVRSDFTAFCEAPDETPDDRRVVFFPGSTIGNLEPEVRSQLLRDFRNLAGRGGRLLIGFDLVKDEETLVAAYNDSEGVTAEFNLNLLDRINRELDADFDRARFEHDAPWVEAKRRIEMHLVSLEDQEVTVEGRAFRFRKGERMQTESSHKFAPSSFDAVARSAGFELEERWTDERDWFCVALFRRAG